MRISSPYYLSISNNGTPREKPAVVDWIDDYLWGDGFYEQGRAYYPPPPGSRQYRARCVRCGKPIPLDEHVDLDGLPYHEYCLSVRILHTEERQ
ncbi:MAG: hypothetical protein HWN51_02230 [Desulfobacterales bacterium]|nr:hypothetical protein [Desulfobacterales bacterium]